jgi:hypothetical protein
MYGERALRKANNRGKDYYKKRGFTSPGKGRMYGVSLKAGSNKITKRLTMKSERNQVKQYLIKLKFQEEY